MRTTPLLFLLGLLACDGDKNDVDGDGVSAPSDCNDEDPDVAPGIDETCDGADNNCDGQIDENLAAQFWPDADGDGFGQAASVPVFACEAPAGHAAEHTDCDDVRNDINPGADEDCGPDDLNCDGDPVAGAADLVTWYRDADDDTFGRSDIVLVQCDQPPGYVASDGDCDDGDASANPNGTETCDGADEDCNGYVDDNATDATQRWADTDGDGYGDPASSQAACDGSGYVENSDDCDDTNVLVYPGGTEVCDGGVDNDCDPSTDEDQVDGSAYYVDGDGDTYGAPGALLACTPPVGSATSGTDCNDGNPTINPGAPEMCGGPDENCDALFDVNAADATDWYNDNDNDSYGNPFVQISSCTPVAGYVLDASDCNDFSVVSYPGAPELCDGLDNDCDIATTDDDSPTAPLWYVDADDDSHGDPLVTVRACNLPVGASALGDDCDDADPTSYPGNIEICDGGIDNDCDPVSDENLTAVWYYDGDNDGFGIDSNTVNGCTPPVDYVQVSGDCDDTDPAINPVATPNCVLEHCGTIALSQTWQNTVEHKITCDVAVEGAAKPTLTLQDGVVVVVDPGMELRIGKGGEGRLVVNGGGLGVRITSSQPFPVPGDWDGVVLGASDQGSVVVGLTVEYAGLNGEGGVVVEGGNPTFSELTSQNNLGDGLYVSASEPLIYDSNLIDNTDNGLWVGVGAGLARAPASGGTGPSFQNNILTGNGGRPITVPGSHADEIELSNVVGPNTVNEIELLTGTMRFAGTWYDHGIDYRAANNAKIDVEDGPATELMVEDGVTVLFGVGAELNIGDGAGGRLETIDGPLGIVFSATPEVIALSSNWDGVKFGADDTGSDVRNLLIEYGGANTFGNLYVDASAPTFSNVTSQFSDTSGMYVKGTAAAPSIQDSFLLSNDEHGVYVESTSGIARSLLGPTFVNNLLTGNGQSSVVMPPNFIGELDPSTAFTGNGDRIAIHGGDVLEDALWRKLDEDYQVLGDIDIAGPQDPVLEIEDLVTMYFDRDSAINAGMVDDGALLIDVANGVLMTSSDPAPGEGDWEGIEIGRNGILRQQTRLRNLTVVYAGGSDVADGGAIEINDRDACTSKENYVDLDDLTILASSKAGVFSESYTYYSIDDITISGALGGCIDVVVPIGCAAPDIVSATNIDCQDGVVFGTWPIEKVAELDATSSYPGPVVIEATTLKQSVTMPALPVPYQFTSLMKINDDANPILTVSTGAALEFNDEAGFEVGVGKLGGLVVQPNVLMTSSALFPSAGDWEGVRFGGLCTTVNVDNSDIEYAGDNNQGAFWFDTCTVGSITNNAITDSSTCAVKAAPVTVTVTGNTFGGNLVGDICP